MNWIQLPEEKCCLDIPLIYSKNDIQQLLLLSEWKLIAKINEKLKLISKHLSEKILKIYKFYKTEFNTPSPAYSVIPSELEG